MRFGQVHHRAAGAISIEHQLATELTVGWDLLGVTDVELTRTSIARGAFANLARLPILRFLHLYQCDLTDADTPASGAFPRLESLVLDDTHLFDEVVTIVQQLPKLRKLEFNPCAHEQQEFYGRLLSNANLEDVSLVVIPLTDEHLSHLRRLPRIARIDIFVSGFAERRLSLAGIESLLTAIGRRKLELSINGRVNGLTNEALQRLAAQYPTVTIQNGPR